MIPAIIKHKPYNSLNNSTHNTIQYNCGINGLSNDIFQYSNQSNPTFGAIPYDEVNKLCDDLLKEEIHFLSVEEKSLGAMNFFHNKIRPILSDEIAETQKEKNFLVDFRHTLENIFNSNSVKKTVSKYGLQKLVKEARGHTEGYKAMERVENGVASMQSLFNLLEDELNSPDIILTGKELIHDKNVKNILQLHKLMLQPILNAKKYNGKNPIKINIEEVIKNDKKAYYATFTNEGTTPISECDRLEILKGEGHHAPQGTGYGFRTMIEILRNNGRDEDILSMIKPNLTSGVEVKIPLIGVCD